MFSLSSNVRIDELIRYCVYKVLRSSAVFAILTPLLVVASFPSWDRFYFIYIALLPLFYISKRSYPFYWGWLCGMLTFLGLTYWLANVIHTFGSIPLVLSYLCLFLLTAYAGLSFGLFTLLISRVNGRLILIAAPVFWVALEYIRANILTGFPLGILGYSQTSFLYLVQMADITGVYGISFLILLTNSIIYYALSQGGSLFTLRLLPHSLLLVLIFGIACGYGYFRVSTLEVSERYLDVGIIQGNISQSDKWDEAFKRLTVDKYKKLSEAARNRGARLLVWPETAMPFLFDQDKRFKQEVLELASGLDVSIVLGAPTLQSRRGEEYFLNNSAFLISDDGRVAGKYNKVHLVPFGEYVPLKSLLFFIKRLVMSAGEFVPGDAFPLLKLPDAGFGVLICYEIIFPELVREYALQGADFLVVITNDAWYGRTTAPFQLFSMGIIRSVESRLPLVRSANTGISGFIDSAGRTVGSSELFVDDLLVDKVALGGAGPTIYTQYGDFFAVGCVIISLAFMLFHFLRRG